MNKQMDEKITAFLSANRDQIFADVDRLLRHDSVTGEPKPGAPFGQEIKDTIDEMLAICAAHGLKTRNIDGMIGEAVWGDGEQSLGVITHMDIVPVGSGWTKPALQLTVEGGMMFGRGVTDDKGPAVASLWALLAALDAGAVINKRIVFLFGGDEETSMRCARRYLETEQAPDMSFSPDASFPGIFCEKTISSGTLSVAVPAGSALKEISGGTRTNVVPGEASALLSVKPDGPLPDGITVLQGDGGWLIKAAGIPAHAMVPEKGDNAIVKLLGALVTLLPAGDPAVPGVSALQRLCAAIDGSGFGIACRDDVSGALTFNLGVIRLAGGSLEARFDIRHPVYVDAETNLLKVLPAAAAAQGITASGIVISPGFCIPKDHVLCKTLTGVYNQINGTNDEPEAIGGGTYARKLPNAMAFGMLFPDDPETAHMADERISVESFMKAARIFANAIAELGRA